MGEGGNHDNMRMLLCKLKENTATVLALAQSGDIVNAAKLMEKACYRRHRPFSGQRNGLHVDDGGSESSSGRGGDGNYLDPTADDASPTGHQRDVSREQKRGSTKKQGIAARNDHHPTRAKIPLHRNHLHKGDSANRSELESAPRDCRSREFFRHFANRVLEMRGSLNVKKVKDAQNRFLASLIARQRETIVSGKMDDIDRLVEELGSRVSTDADQRSSSQ
jgi:hypothetical protein